MTINFGTLVGEMATLYYLNRADRFQLGSVEFEVEVADDDQRSSYVSHINIINKNAPKGQRLADVTIKVCDSDDINGYDIVDTSDGFVWITFGTNVSDIYYPFFVFKRNAKPTPEEEIKQLIK